MQERAHMACWFSRAKSIDSAQMLLGRGDDRAGGIVLDWKVKMVWDGKVKRYLVAQFLTICLALLVAGAVVALYHSRTPAPDVFPSGFSLMLGSLLFLLVAFVLHRSFVPTAPSLYQIDIRCLGNHHIFAPEEAARRYRLENISAGGTQLESSAHRVTRSQTQQTVCECEHARAEPQREAALALPPHAASTSHEVFAIHPKGIWVPKVGEPHPVGRLLPGVHAEEEATACSSPQPWDWAIACYSVPALSGIRRVKIARDREIERARVNVEQVRVTGLTNQRPECLASGLTVKPSLGTISGFPVDNWPNAAFEVTIAEKSKSDFLSGYAVVNNKNGHVFGIIHAQRIADPRVVSVIPIAYILQEQRRREQEQRRRPSRNREDFYSRERDFALLWLGGA